MTMKLGADPKKVKFLGGLVVVALIVFYFNVIDSGPDSGTGVNLPAARPNGVSPSGGSATAARTPAARRSTEFRPTLKRPSDEVLDPAKIDPTLRLDLLSKLQTVTFNGNGRNIFEFGTAPPPPIPESAKKPEPKIIPQSAASTPPPPVTPAKPQAPPIPLKFYGYISTPRGVAKRGFFLDGEDIVVASEGDTIKQRYKVVRIGLNNVDMEDTQFHQQQTLRLEEPPGGVG